MSSVSLIPAFDRRSELIPLYEEYAAMLLETDPVFARSLAQQNYDEEVQNLKVKYDYPMGRLYIALDDSDPGAMKAAGCIGLKPFDEGRCELKRLYVRPAYRGQKLGELLVAKIVEDAREIGYRTILLDTLPFLQTAKALYERMGFTESEKHNDSPMDTSIFMKMDL